MVVEKASSRESLPQSSISCEEAVRTEHSPFPLNTKGIRIVTLCLRGMVGVGCLEPEQVELRNVPHLNIFHGNSKKIARSLQRFVCGKQIAG